MANETISTSIDELSNIIIQEARLTIQNRQDLRNTVMRRDVPAGSISTRFPKYGNISAAAVSEGAAASNTEIATTGVVLTPATNAVVKSFISDLASHSAPQIAADFGRVAGDAILKKMNADIFALYDGFSTAVGTTNTDLTVAVVRTGVKKLMQANARGEIMLMITPEVWEDLMTDIADTSGYNSMISDNMRDAINAGALDVRIPLLGCTVGMVTSGIAETGDVKCGLYTPEALGYAQAWDIRVAFQRQEASIGYDIVASSAYAVGEIDDSFGVEVLADGADA